MRKAALHRVRLSFTTDPTSTGTEPVMTSLPPSSQRVVPAAAVAEVCGFAALFLVATKLSDISVSSLPASGHLDDLPGFCWDLREETDGFQLFSGTPIR